MKKIISFLFAFCTIATLWAQNGQASLSGVIASKQSGKGIAGATVTLGNQDISL